MKYKRILLKLSGGALSGESEKCFNKESIGHITDEIIKASEKKIEIAVLIGGGNIFRGRTADEWKMERVDADNIGMMATIINSLILKEALKSKTDRDIRVMTSMPVEKVAETYIRPRAIKHLDKGSIVIFGGGLGEPLITTDYPSVQRAIEIKADVVLMAKEGTNGVYTEDPGKKTNAKRYKTLNSKDAIINNLKVADQAAFILANEYNMPMYVFDFNEKNAISRICEGEDLGTFVSNDCKTELY